MVAEIETTKINRKKQAQLVGYMCRILQVWLVCVKLHLRDKRTRLYVQLSVWFL